MIKKDENLNSSDPATFVVIKNSLYAAAEEMKVVLAKTAYSPILKVAGDYSCGIFDSNGEMVAQGPDLPIHLGSMPDAVKAVISAFESFNTGIRYQMYHAFLLFFIGGTTPLKSSQKSILSKLISTGLLLFSGSIYLLSTNDLTSFNFKVIGFITPVGGLILIASWMLLFTYFFRIKK